MLCNDCKDKKCTKTGKPCKEVEKYLRDNKIWGRNWIRPMMPSNKRGDGQSAFREIPFSNLPYKKQQELGVEPSEDVI